MILDVPFNFANVIVLLLFGLGVSSGINMAVRGRQQGSGSLLITSTPKAVLFSALTAIGSFGSLALSTHPGMASMGLLLTVALIYSTLCTLIVLPALRHVFHRLRAPDGPLRLFFRLPQAGGRRLRPGRGRCRLPATDTGGRVASNRSGTSWNTLARLPGSPFLAFLHSLSEEAPGDWLWA